MNTWIVVAGALRTVWVWNTLSVKVGDMMKGWSVDEHFVERGVSGSIPLADRPEGGRMLATIGKNDVVVRRFDFDPKDKRDRPRLGRHVHHRAGNRRGAAFRLRHRPGRRHQPLCPVA